MTAAVAIAPATGGSRGEGGRAWSWFGVGSSTTSPLHPLAPSAQSSAGTAAGGANIQTNQHQHAPLAFRAGTRTDRSNKVHARAKGSGLSAFHFAITGLFYTHDPPAFRQLALGRRFGVIGGISEAERRCLSASHSRDRSFLVRTWILRLALDRHAKGGLNVPAPVVTRTYQLVSEGVHGYQQARKVGDTPFPFPYVQLVTLLLHGFNVLAPITVAALVTTTRDLDAEEEKELEMGDYGPASFVRAAFLYASGNALIAAIVFLVSIGYTALNQVARELEEPFGHGPNHLPLVQSAEEFNSKLVHLLLADAGAEIPDDPFIGADAESLSAEEKQVSPGSALSPSARARVSRRSGHRGRPSRCYAPPHASPGHPRCARSPPRRASALASLGRYRCAGA
jgi:hypothetical protein